MSGNLMSLANALSLLEESQGPTAPGVSFVCAYEIEDVRFPAQDIPGTQAYAWDKFLGQFVEVVCHGPGQWVINTES